MDQCWCGQEVGRYTRDRNRVGRWFKPEVPKWSPALVCQEFFIIFFVLFITVDKSKYLRNICLLAMGMATKRSSSVHEVLALACWHHVTVVRPSSPLSLKRMCKVWVISGMCSWPRKRRDLAISVTATKRHSYKKL